MILLIRLERINILKKVMIIAMMLLIKSIINASLNYESSFIGYELTLRILEHESIFMHQNYHRQDRELYVDLSPPRV